MKYDGSFNNFPVRKSCFWPALILFPKPHCLQTQCVRQVLKSAIGEVRFAPQYVGQGRFKGANGGN